MKILWIDDEILNIQSIKEFLEDNSHSVKTTSSLIEALNLVKSENFDLVLIDLYMPDNDNVLEPNSISGGYKTGISLAREMKKIQKTIKIIGCSISNDLKAKSWFSDYCNGFINKAEIALNNAFLRKLENVVNDEKHFNVFIVHGHDSKTLLELKNFLQNKLRFDEPIILREQPSLGKTIIEKFEHYTDDIDLVFVIMTPDDLAFDSKKGEIRRSRQNVIFEMGYFYGKLQRKSGKIIILYEGEVEIPSDISGIIYIQIEGSFDSVTEKIRNELRGII